MQRQPSLIPEVQPALPHASAGIREATGNTHMPGDSSVQLGHRLEEHEQAHNTTKFAAAQTPAAAAAAAWPRYVLGLATDLADRLLPAFATPTGIPLSWVNLRKGRVAGDVEDTCAACAATLALEFRLLSHFTANPIYARAADRAVKVLLRQRSRALGLLGNTIDTRTAQWTRADAGIGAGADSTFEYLLKTYLMCA